MAQLYLTLGQNGGIWSGKPNAVTGTGTVYLETSGVTEPLYQAASNASTTTSTFKVVVVGQSGDILSSNRNGDLTSTWSTVHTASKPLQAVAYGNSMWVAGGDNNLVLHSTDGTTWTEAQGAVKTSTTWVWASYGNGKFVMVGTKTLQGKQVGAAQYSTDGINWTEASTGAQYPLQSVAYSPDLNVFVAVGNNGTIVSVNG